MCTFFFFFVIPLYHHRWNENISRISRQKIAGSYIVCCVGARRAGKTTILPPYTHSICIRDISRYISLRKVHCKGSTDFQLKEDTHNVGFSCQNASPSYIWSYMIGRHGNTAHMYMCYSNGIGWMGTMFAMHTTRTLQIHRVIRLREYSPNRSEVDCTTNIFMNVFLYFDYQRGEYRRQHQDNSMCVYGPSSAMTNFIECLASK